MSKLVWSLVLITSLALLPVAYAAGHDNLGKQDKQKPIHATNIELAKKATIRRPPNAGGGGVGKKVDQAATGVLGEPVQGERYAVVVGISDYPGTANDLNYCDDDARDMQAALRDVYGYTETNITTLTDSSATYGAILGAISSVPEDAGEVVLFFSGHGATANAEDGDSEKRDEGFVCHDGTNFAYIWDGELRQHLAQFDETARIICIFDICYAGGMKQDLEAPVRVIAMATTETSLAIEYGDEIQNGEFTYYFVERGIVAGNANVHDYDGDALLNEPNQVTAEEAFDYAKANCGYDRPTIGDYFDNDLLF